MIIIRIHSGLGNQLFQYAAARRLAYYHNTELKLETHSFPYCKLSHFNVSASIATLEEANAIQYKRLFGLEKVYKRIKKQRLVDRRRFIEERFFHFDSRLLSAPNNAYLVGYWQTEKYFKDIEPIIRKELTLKEPLTEKASRYADLIESTTAVCVHIRRGDYLTDAYFDVCPIEYYQKAFQQLCQSVNNPHLFVFSDDPTWVQEHFCLDAPTTIVTGNPDYEDLHLMSLCQHFIIANSTFSWWGAWLSQSPQKQVYAPRTWFSDTLKHYDVSDLLPADWVIV